LASAQPAPPAPWPNRRRQPAGPASRGPAWPAAKTGTPLPTLGQRPGLQALPAAPSHRRSLGHARMRPARDAELHGPVPSPVGPACQPGKKRKDGDAASPSARRLPSVVLFAWYPASPSPPASSVSQPDDAARTPRPTARPRMPLHARRPEPRLALRTRRDTTGLAPHRALTAPASRPHHTVTCSSSRTFPSRAPTPCHGWTPRVRLPHPDDRSRP